jgi:hypothetical protein
MYILLIYFTEIEVVSAQTIFIPKVVNEESLSTSLKKYTGSGRET